MKKSFQYFLALSATAVACLQTTQAQTPVFPNAPPYGVVQVSFTQQDLDAMLAPIALYPDALLTQILMAATYPMEVAEAARWSAAIPGVAPQEAVRSVAQRGWDPSVQSLMAFPQVLQMMGSAPDWTQRLGDAFLGQQAQVWATVQALRQRAYAAGQLRSNEQIRVLHNGSIIMLEPSNPEVIYVPYYDPLVVYGRWWWPGYAPMRWNPWPGYAMRPGLGASIYLGSGIDVGLNFFFGQINWNTSRATVMPHPQWNDQRTRPGQPGQDWRHDPNHRRDVPYSSPPARPQPVPRSSVPEKRPEFRGQVPTPRVKVEPVPAAPRRPADNSEQRSPGRSRSDQGSAAPTLPTPTAPRPTAVPTQRPDTGRVQGTENRGQKAAPGGGERPVSQRAPAEPKAQAESRAAPREPGKRGEDPPDKNPSGR